MHGGWLSCNLSCAFALQMTRRDFQGQWEAYAAQQRRSALQQPLPHGWTLVLDHQAEAPHLDQAERSHRSSDGDSGQASSRSAPQACRASAPGRNSHGFGTAAALQSGANPAMKAACRGVKAPTVKGIAGNGLTWRHRSQHMSSLELDRIITEPSH